MFSTATIDDKSLAYLVCLAAFGLETIKNDADQAFDEGLINNFEFQKTGEVLEDLATSAVNVLSYDKQNSELDLKYFVRDFVKHFSSAA